jgi:hypothetical protein
VREHEAGNQSGFFFWTSHKTAELNYSDRRVPVAIRELELEELRDAGMISLRNGRHEGTYSGKPTALAIAALAELSDQAPVKVGKSIGSRKAAEACQRYMDANKLTAETLAIQIGVSTRTIHNFLAKGTVKRENFDAIARTMGLTRNQLLAGSWPPDATSTPINPAR